MRQVVNDGFLTPAARRLGEALAEGAVLRPRAMDDVPLSEGELGYADVRLDGWRYLALHEPVYERRTVLVGGPCLMAAGALASAVGNRRRRQAAKRASGPEWWPLGCLRVVVTGERLLIWHGEAWWSVWLSTVTRVDCDVVAGVMDLCFDADSPYRLVGPQVELVAVFVSWRIGPFGQAARSG
jgi:hypothetical protein